MKNSSKFSVLKNLCFIIFFISFFKAHVYAQNINLFSLENDSANIGFIPSDTYLINGIGIKYSETMFDSADTDCDVNGIRLGVDPFTMFMPFLMTIHAYEISDEDYDSTPNDITQFNIVNGIDLSLFNSERTKVNGLEVNFSGNFGSFTNGLSIGLVNNHYKINGLGIGVLRNKSSKCRGIQIGIVNECSDLKGLQIGLWNKSKKRKMPFINWNF
ncbi:LA_2272 family surface repeat-containing protein [uncultured Tenacibaculum sp.]|uniref:LA_2272 family surface repeat-containing protein n=1 Tax=uncultured Tenacibaculum sp. TaxID=174713 RepID=UPI002634A2A1|nr:hypothetical protein [uncultured Tenacibaculum sp.]